MALWAFLANDGPSGVRWGELLEPRDSVARGHSWGGLLRVIRERPVTGAVIDLERLPVYPSPERALANLRAGFPHLCLVLVVRTTRDPNTLYHLGKLGIRDLVLLPVESAGFELPRTLARAGEGSATSLVMRALGSFLPRRELQAVYLAMDSVHRRWTADELARAVGLARPYLSERLKALGLPSVGHLLLWTRLLHAGQWLEEPGRTGESVGRQLEYSSGAAFRRALKHYTGATPTQVRERGGLRFVFHHFLRRNALLGRRRAWGRR